MVSSSPAIDRQRQRVDVLLAAAAVQDASDHITSSRALLSNLAMPPPPARPLQQPVSRSAFKTLPSSTEPAAAVPANQSASTGGGGAEPEVIADAAICETPRIPARPHTTGAVLSASEHLRSKFSSPKRAAGLSFNAWSLGAAQQPNTLAFSSPGGPAWPTSPAYTELASFLGSPPAVGLQASQKTPWTMFGGSGGKSRFAMDSMQTVGKESAGALRFTEAAPTSHGCIAPTDSTGKACKDLAIDPLVTKDVQRRLELDNVVAQDALPAADPPVLEGNPQGSGLPAGACAASVLAQAHTQGQQLADQKGTACPTQPFVAGNTADHAAQHVGTEAGWGRQDVATAPFAPIPCPSSAEKAAIASTGARTQLPTVPNIWPVGPAGSASSGEAASVGAYSAAERMIAMGGACMPWQGASIGLMPRGPAAKQHGPMPRLPLPMHRTRPVGEASSLLPVVPLLFSPNSTDGGSSLGKRTWHEEVLMSSCLGDLSLVDSSPALNKYARLAYTQPAGPDAALSTGSMAAQNHHEVAEGPQAGMGRSNSVVVDIADLAPPPPDFKATARSSHAPAKPCAGPVTASGRRGRVTKSKNGRPPPVPGPLPCSAPTAPDAGPVLVRAESVPGGSLNSLSGGTPAVLAAGHPPGAHSPAVAPPSRSAQSNSHGTTETAGTSRHVSDGAGTADSPVAEDPGEEPTDAAPPAPARGRSRATHATAPPFVVSRSASAGGSDFEQPSGKVKHPQVERNRRNMINNYIDVLRILVPATSESPSTHYIRNNDNRPKHAVLSETIDCVQTLRERVDSANRHMHEMRRQHEDEIKLLKDQITLLDGALRQKREQLS